MRANYIRTSVCVPRESCPCNWNTSIYLSNIFDAHILLEGGGNMEQIDLVPDVWPRHIFIQ